jgi:hypothetical protein
MATQFEGDSLAPCHHGARERSWARSSFGIGATARRFRVAKHCNVHERVRSDM